MPSCLNCGQNFTPPPAMAMPGRGTPYCQNCRCKEINCPKPRPGALAGGKWRPSGEKCRTHLGLCANPNCQGRVAQGKTLCVACEMARKPAGSRTDVKKDLMVADNRRSNAVYKDRLEKSPTYKQHVNGVLAALGQIGTTKEFNKYLTELTGWKNLKSWASWALRSAEPAMLAKDRLTSVIEILRMQMLELGKADKYFGERFLEEVILVCQNELDKTDVAFTIQVGFMVFGPLLAPYTAAAAAAAGASTSNAVLSAVRSTATSAGTSLAQSVGQAGITGGAGYGTVGSAMSAGMSEGNTTAPTNISSMAPPATRSRSDATWSELHGRSNEDWSVSTRGRSGAVTSQPATAAEQYHYSVNPAQYAECLFKYLGELGARASRTEELVITEFGGVKKVNYLYETLAIGPDD